MTHLERVLAARRPVSTAVAVSPAAAAAATAVVVFTRDELDLIVELACSLDESPGKNWVEKAGGLPDYICRIARAVKRSGKTTSQAIAIAVSRVKKWATGAGVNADTQAKATKALSEWEALKAKSKSKSRNRFGATHTGDVLCLAAPAEFNVDIVRKEFETKQREARALWRKNNPTCAYDDGPPHVWVKEQWTTFLIVEGPGYQDAPLHKIPYVVGPDQSVTFGDPVPVKTEYVVVPENEFTGSELTDAALAKLLDLPEPAATVSATGRLLAFTAGGSTAARSSALDRVVALATNPFAKGGKPAGKPFAHTEADKYADPGYQADKKKRYALDTATQVRAAWSYINQRQNAALYDAADLARVKGRIKAAAKRLGVTISDD